MKEALAVKARNSVKMMSPAKLWSTFVKSRGTIRLPPPSTAPKMLVVPSVRTFGAGSTVKVWNTVSRSHPPSGVLGSKQARVGRKSSKTRATT
jgi:hypothetical protein